MSEPLGKRNIFFIGEKTEFFEQIEDKFIQGDISHFIYNFEYGGWNEFFLSLDFNTPDILFIDFSAHHDEEKISGFINNIIRLKRAQELKQIPIFNIYENKDQVVNSEIINHVGINYHHVVGDDFNLFFGNIYYISFEDESNLLKLARALKMKLTMNVFHDCLIEGISGFQLRVSSDIIFEEDFKSKIRDNFEGRDLSLSIEEMQSNSNFSSCFNTYSLDLDLSEGQWDSTEELEAEVCEEDYRSWFSNLKQDQVISPGEQVVVQMFTTKPSKALTLVSEKTVPDVQINIFKHFLEAEAGLTRPPDFIIFECDSDESLDEADLLLSYYSNEEKQPIVLLLNHPSKTAAIKKMYAYEKVLVYTDELNLIGFDQMIKMIKSSPGHKDDFELYANLNDALTLAYPVEIMITSLTENELTFMTDIEIPFYSHLSLRIGELNVGLIVVPSYINLSPNVKGFHYISLIHRCSEADRQTLRGIVKKFVDQIPDSWVDVDLISFTPEEQEDQPSVIIVDKDEVVAAPQADDKNPHKNTGIKRSKSVNGKSKL
jgi:hypothetical protein